MSVVSSLPIANILPGTTQFEVSLDDFFGCYSVVLIEDS